MLSSTKLIQRSVKYAQFLLMKNTRTSTTANCIPGMITTNTLKEAQQKCTRTISMSIPQAQKDELDITFVRVNGERINAKGKVGDTLLDVIVNNNIDLDGFGACEGTLTCSTCHLIFKQEDYDKLPDKPSDEEADMLDLAYDLSDTSRLGCQITLTKDMNGLEVQVPSTVNDARTAP